MELSQSRFEKELTAFSEAHSLAISKQAIPFLYRYLCWLSSIDFLTGKLSLFNLFSDLLCDSLLALPLLKKRGAILDFGTGGGIPGLPLAITCPESHFLLLDCQQRKVNALKSFLQTQPLPQVTLCWARAEDHAAEQRERYSQVLVKGIKLSQALEIGLPLLQKGGTLLHWERSGTPTEKAAAQVALLGGTLSSVKLARLPSQRETQLVVFLKVSATPARYPRSFAKIKKSPLNDKRLPVRPHADRAKGRRGETEKNLEF